MTLDLKELERLARAATPGPWIASDPTDTMHAIRTASRRIVADVGYSGTLDGDKANAAYIAYANPAYILSLQSELEQAKKDAEKNKLSRIDRECLLIGQEIQRAAGELPEFYELEVYVERGYGCAYMRDPDGGHKTFDDTVDGLSHCIKQAIDAALAKESA